MQMCTHPARRACVFVNIYARAVAMVRVLVNENASPRDVRESAWARGVRVGASSSMAYREVAAVGIGLAAFVVRRAGLYLIPKPLNPQPHDIVDFDGSDRKGYGRLIAFQR